MRALRRHHRERVIAARLRAARTFGIPTDVPGMFEDRHPLDCGNTKCGVCHPSKRWHSKERRRLERAL